MPRRPLADKGVQTSVRLPRDLYDRLISAAGDKGIGEEIRQRLEASFTPTTVGLEDPRFRELLTAIGHAAAAAAKMPATREVAVRGGGNVRREDDKTPFVAFREAVTSLMDAFEPEGVRMASDQILIRLADQLVGIALGALGDRGLTAFSNLAEVDQASMERSGGEARALAAKAKRRRRPEEGSQT